MKKRLPSILLFVLCFSQVISLVKLYTLENELQNTKNHLSASASNTDMQIQQIYENVDAKLKKQTSILDSIHYELGEIEKDTLTLPVTFTLTPKEITKDGTVKLNLTGKDILMKRSGTTFSATTSLDIFKLPIPTILIENGNTVKSEQWEEFSLENIKERVIPSLYATMSGSATYRSGEYHRSGMVNVEYKKTDSGIAFVDVRLVIDVDKKVVFDKKISPDSDWERLSYEFDQKIPLEENQSYTMTLIATDTLGLSHHCVIDSWQSSDHSRTPNLNQETIYNKDGKLLYSVY